MVSKAGRPTSESAASWMGIVIAAPLLTYLNLGDGQVNRELSTALAYLLLPEILFYGLSALFIAFLNLRGYFNPGARAPVLNNVVQITTLVLYAVVPGEITLNPVRMSDPQLLVLGIGCTTGVVLQALILVPFLRKSGVRLRLQWGIDARLRQAWRFDPGGHAIATADPVDDFGVREGWRRLKELDRQLAPKAMAQPPPFE